MATLEVKITGLPTNATTANPAAAFSGQLKILKEMEAAAERVRKTFAAVQFSSLKPPPALAETAALQKRIAEDVAKVRENLGAQFARQEQARAARTVATEKRLFDQAWAERSRRMRSYWEANDRLQEISIRKGLAGAARVASAGAGLAGRGLSKAGDFAGRGLGGFGTSLGSAIGGIGSGGIGGAIRGVGSLASSTLGGSFGLAGSAFSNLGGSVGGGLLKLAPAIALGGGPIFGPLAGGATALLGGGVAAGGALLGGATQLAGGVLGGLTQAAAGLASTIVEKTIGAVKVGIAAGIGTAIAAGIKAAKLEPIESAFNALNKATGTSGPAALAKLSSAVRGTVDDFQLMLSFNRAVTLGAVKNADDFAVLAESATKLGRAVGRDAADALEDIALGIGRQSRLILDNLGIIISAEGAYEKFAAKIGKTSDQLTDAEQKTAFQTEALRKLREAAARTGDTSESFSEKWQRLTASISNALAKAGRPLLDVFGKIVPVLTDGARALGRWFEDNRVAIAEKLSAVLAAITERVEAIAGAIKEKGLGGFFEEGIQKGREFVTGVWEFFETEAGKALKRAGHEVKIFTTEIKRDIAALYEPLQGGFLSSPGERIKRKAAEAQGLPFTDRQGLDDQLRRLEEQRATLGRPDPLLGPYKGAISGPRPGQVLRPPAAIAAPSPLNFLASTARTLTAPVSSVRPPQDDFDTRQFSISATALRGAEEAIGSAVLQFRGILIKGADKLAAILDEDAAAIDGGFIKRAIAGIREQLKLAANRKDFGANARLAGVSSEDFKAIFDDETLKKVGLEAFESINASLRSARATEALNKKVEEVTRDRVGAEVRITSAIQIAENKRAAAISGALEASERFREVTSEIAKVEEEILSVRLRSLERQKEAEAQVAQLFNDRLRSLEQSLRGALPGAINDPALPRNIRRGLEKGQRLDDRETRSILEAQFGNLSAQDIAASPRLRARVEAGVVGARVTAERPIEAARDLAAFTEFPKVFGPEVEAAREERSAGFAAALEEISEAEEAATAAAEEELSVLREHADASIAEATAQRELSSEMTEVLRTLTKELEATKSELDKMRAVVQTFSSGSRR